MKEVNKNMFLLDEFNELRKTIIPWLLCFVIFAIFFFVFGIKQIELGGKTILLPVPDSDSISVQVLKIMRNDLVPNNVQLITTSPTNAFLAQVTISLFLAFMASLPFFLYKVMKYLFPALHKHEKKALFKVLIPSTLLFVTGCIFSYFLLIPSTFNILYAFAQRMEVEEFFTINSFVALTLGLMVVSGVIFLLPVFMILLSRLGLVESSFWKRNWRIAVFVLLLFSAIITPDGTGITMILFAIPLVLLYFSGYILSLKINKGRQKKITKLNKIK